MKDKRLYARHAKVKRGAQLHKMQWKRRGGDPVLGKQTAIHASCIEVFDE